MASIRCQPARRKRLRDDLTKSADPQDWALKYARREITYVRIAEMVVAYSAYFRAEAGKYDFPVFEMDENFLERVEDVTQYLVDRSTSSLL